MSLYTDENIKPEPVMDLYNTHEVENLVAENAELKAQVGIDVITHGRLGYEIESLKGQVENLSALWEIAHAERSEAMLELTTLQSKFDALVDALVDALETTVPYLWNSSAIGADVVAEQTLAVIKGAK